MIRRLICRLFLGAVLALTLLTTRPAAADGSDPVVLVRVLPSVLAWFADPDSLLREEPLEMSNYDTATNTETPAPPVTDCTTLQARQADGYYTYTTIGMAREALVTDLCRLGGRYGSATVEPTESPKHTLHADVLDLWSAWFQLAVSANVADAVAKAVETGVPLGGFEEPSLAGCGPRAVERKDPWTVAAQNKCDSLYLSVVGEEHTASGKMRPIVFYHLKATGGSLRTSGYTAVAPHPETGVWTPLVFLD
ncbi:MAG: hypothetical protein RLO01_11520 [Thalassobaculaceae bacterium]